MTMLQGGVEQNDFQGGASGGSIGGATPWGAIIQQIGEHRQAARQGFRDLAGNLSNNALAASMSNVSFNPQMTAINPAQQLQFQPQNNLYNRLIG